MTPVVIAIHRHVEPRSVTDLVDAGLTADQIAQPTGFGLRHIDDCEPVDTIGNKYLAGALSLEGACRILEGQ